MKGRKSGKKQENSDTVISDILSEIKIHLRIETVCSAKTEVAAGAQRVS